MLYRPGEADGDLGTATRAGRARHTGGVFGQAPMQSRRAFGSERRDQPRLGLSRHGVPGEKENMVLGTSLHCSSPSARAGSRFQGVGRSRAGCGVLTLRTSSDSIIRTLTNGGSLLTGLMLSFGMRSNRVPEQRG